jgi:hypothetical protein
MTRAQEFYNSTGGGVATMPYRAPEPGTPRAEHNARAQMTAKSTGEVFPVQTRLVTPGHSARCTQCRTWTRNGGGCPGLVMGLGAVHRELGLPMPEVPNCYDRFGREEIAA